FHHDPLHNDDFLDRVGELAVQQYKNTIMAREGLVISLAESPVPNPMPLQEVKISV
ncbi:MAG TPA: MBL fold metallo-hydrolase, partial [Cyanobacteria bacterium UBA11162]|nr:MBL fold metallo-hydrolase [Cyanobacteria bacterium UBA11162]